MPPNNRTGQEMAKLKKYQRKTLYFVSGPKPTDAQLDEANDLEGLVVFRNAHKVDPDGVCEPFDDVAGDVPPLYRAEADARAIVNALTGEGEPQPEPKASLPPAGSPVAPVTRRTAPKGAAGTPAAPKAPAPWVPNA